MALFQPSTYSSYMHSDDRQSQQAIPLASAIPSTQSCTISQLIAFPSSLAALKLGIKWNASCWVANQRLDEFEQSQIAQYAFRGQQRTPHIEWCHFASDLNENVSMLIVFPELRKSFREAGVMERWTDTVVLPAFRQLGLSESVLATNFKIIQMTSEAEREQTLNTYAPDTALVEVLAKNGGMTSQDMHSLWTLIQENANKTTFFDGFKNLFLVATCRRPASSLRSLPMEEAWRTVTSSWDDSVDMNFVPVESVRVNASVTISAQHIGGGSHAAINGHGSVAPYQPTSDSIWESSRKRKVEDETDSDKRVRSELDQPRPVLPGRGFTSSSFTSVQPESDGMDEEMAM